MTQTKKAFTTEDLEITKPGYSNGISTQLAELIAKGEHRSLNDKEKQKIIKRASKVFEKFLTEMGVDFANDPNSMDTATRFTKALVNDIWKGRYNVLDDISSFPSSYKGIVMEKDIPIVSTCSHHLQTITGKCHIAYVPGVEGRVVGLSKLNRICENFARRGAIQEDLTVAIHKAVSTVVEGNDGVMVVIHASHQCVSCRGVKHDGASMITSEVSGVFADHSKTAKNEVLHFINM